MLLKHVVYHDATILINLLRRVDSDSYQDARPDARSASASQSVNFEYHPLQLSKVEQTRCTYEFMRGQLGVYHEELMTHFVSQVHRCKLYLCQL